MRRLPVGYIELTHIESTGTQYIDTGVKAKSTLRVTMEAQTVDNISSTHFLFGARNDKKDSAFLFFYYNGYWSADYKTSDDRYQFDNTVVPQHCTLVVDANQNIWTVNGESKTFPATTFEADYNVALFAGNTAGTVGNFTPARVFRCQIYDNGTLVRDYVPCISPSKKIGLYDLVNGNFCENAGTGEFIAGDVVIDSDVVVPDKSLGMFFARRRMMAAAKKAPKYVWAVYDFAYVRDDATATTGSFSATRSRTKMAASAYTVNEGGFTLTSAAPTSLQNLTVGQFIVDIGTSSNSTATSGQYLYEVTGKSGSYTTTVQYKRYGVKAAKGETELYRIESDTLDYPVDGEQNGLWYVLIESGNSGGTDTTETHVWDLYTMVFVDLVNETNLELDYDAIGDTIYYVESDYPGNDGGEYYYYDHSAPKSLELINTLYQNDWAWYDECHGTLRSGEFCCPGAYTDTYYRSSTGLIRVDLEYSEYERGAATGKTAESTNPNAYPQDGWKSLDGDINQSYWFVYSHSYIK